MDYIVVDFEWNKRTDYSVMTKISNEIIQIGAVKLNDDFEVVSTFECKIKPTFYPRIDRKVREITHITAIDLVDAVPFPEAVECFADWCGNCYYYLTWGPEDIRVMRENLLAHDMSVTWLPFAFDVQAMFGHFIMNERKQYSLVKALELMNDEQERPHDALNDALNTVKICNHMDMVFALDNYSEVEERFGIECILEDYYDNFFVTKEDAEVFSAVREFTCPYCGENVCCKSWIPDKGKRIGVCHCKNGDEFFVRLKFSARRYGGYSVKRLVYDLSDSLWERYIRVEDAFFGCSVANA